MARLTTFTMRPARRTFIDSIKACVTCTATRTFRSSTLYSVARSISPSGWGDAMPTLLTTASTGNLSRISRKTSSVRPASARSQG
ncbi:hypothetical protein D3C81_1819140 [compost metagenome]